jgi:glycosyltransferase involved in cell wall biosynthesis
MINTLHVIVTVFNRGANLRVLLDSFLVQTNSQWQIHIIHDGAAPQPIRDIVSSYRDPRIQYFETPQVNGSWGHPNRNIALRQLALNHRDYVLMTNDDNYYVPKFIEYFMKECRREDTGFVYCNTLHSYMNYEILNTEVRETLLTWVHSSLNWMLRNMSGLTILTFLPMVYMQWSVPIIAR